MDSNSSCPTSSNPGINLSHLYSLCLCASVVQTLTTEAQRHRELNHCSEHVLDFSDPECHWVLVERSCEQHRLLCQHRHIRTLHAESAKRVGYLEREQHPIYLVTEAQRFLLRAQRKIRAFDQIVELCIIRV